MKLIFLLDLKSCFDNFFVEISNEDYGNRRSTKMATFTLSNLSKAFPCADIHAKASKRANAQVAEAKLFVKKNQQMRGSSLSSGVLAGFIA